MERKSSFPLEKCWIVTISYSDNQKTLEYREDVRVKVKCIWWRCIAFSLQSLILIRLIKIITWVKSRLHIPEYSGSHCVKTKLLLQLMNRRWKIINVFRKKPSRVFGWQFQLHPATPRFTYLRREEYVEA